MTRYQPFLRSFIIAFLSFCVYLTYLFFRKTQKEPFRADHRWDVSLDAYDLLKSCAPHVLIRYAPQP